ncbi:hypothetical protein M1P56_12280 [Streptomyces sp. HU2014]|uniref:hypothetical protein n=1 Tax=Streptomyces sp. HU2014 TaxID=2939414 RepID=UPI00200DA9D3|nr:hypothetical protein [Streptomyces sp. HU2014]UQI45068.1 hypothetical protein M1P56_12280 [Streptomyces sp. HU2014]
MNREPVRALCRGAGCARRGATEAGGPAARPATAGAVLCEVCRERLVRELAGLPGLYEECGRLLGGSERSQEKVSGGPLPGMPFNAAASEARSAILGVLGSWSGLVADERRLRATPPREAAPLARFLLLHAGWLTGHPAADALSREVAKAVRRARHVIEPAAPRRVAVGPCVEAGCRGGLTATLRPGDTSPTAITCDTDPAHHWPGSQWLGLGRRIAAARREEGEGAARVRWLGAGDIARLWDIAPGSVYRYASERGWRRLSRSGRTYYHEADVQETLESRAGTAKAG